METQPEEAVFPWHLSANVVRHSLKNRQMAGVAPTDLSNACATLEADIAALRLHEQGCAGKAKTLAAEWTTCQKEGGWVAAAEEDDDTVCL